MEYFETNVPPPIPEDFGTQARVELCNKVLTDWTQTPPGDDPYLKNYAAAMLQFHNTAGPIYDTTVAVLTARPDMGASHLKTLEQRAMQKQIIALMGEDYPAALGDTEADVHKWLDAIASVRADPERFDEWIYDIHNQELQTNVPYRGDCLEAFLSMANDLGRLTTGNIVEFGCSQNLILKRHARKLAMGADAPMEHYGPNDTDVPLPHIIRDGGLHLQATAANHQLIRQPVPFGYGVGIDSKSPAAGRDWSYNSVYPSEFANKARMTDVHDLIYSDYSNNVGFYQADVTDFDLASFHESFPQMRNATDVVFICTSAYLLPPEKRQGVFDLGIEMVKGETPETNGFLILYDNCMRVAMDPTQVNFFSDWQSVPYCYHFYVMDTRAPEPIWEEFYMSPDTRANTVRVGNGAILDKNGTPHKVWDYMMDMAVDLSYLKK